MTPDVKRKIFTGNRLKLTNWFCKIFFQVKVNDFRAFMENCERNTYVLHLNSIVKYLSDVLSFNLPTNLRDFLSFYTIFQFFFGRFKAATPCRYVKLVYFEDKFRWRRESSKQILQETAQKVFFNAMCRFLLFDQLWFFCTKGFIILIR